MNRKKHFKKSKKKIKFKQSLMNPSLSNKLLPAPFLKSLPLISPASARQNQELGWLELYKNNSINTPLKRSLLSTNNLKECQKEANEEKELSINTPKSYKKIPVKSISTQIFLKPKDIVFETKFLSDSKAVKNITPSRDFDIPSHTTSNFRSVGKVSKNLFDANVIPEAHSPRVCVDDLLAYYYMKSKISFK
jgi:hypothetical protein